MDNRLVAHLQAKPRLLQYHASMLAYLLLSNQDKQAFVTSALASIHSDGPSAVPIVTDDSPQPVGNNDTEPLHFSDYEH